MWNGNRQLVKLNFIIYGSTFKAELAPHPIAVSVEYLPTSYKWNTIDKMQAQEVCDAHMVYVLTRDEIMKSIPPPRIRRELKPIKQSRKVASSSLTQGCLGSVSKYNLKL